MPADIIEKVNADVQKIVGDPEFQKKYLDRFAVQPVSGPLDAFAEYLRQGLGQMGRGHQGGQREDRMSACKAR